MLLVCAYLNEPGLYENIDYSMNCIRVDRTNCVFFVPAKGGAAARKCLKRFGAPDGIRTRVTAVKAGLRPNCKLWLGGARFANRQ